MSRYCAMPWRIVSGTPTIGNMCIFPWRYGSPLLAIFLYPFFEGKNLPSRVNKRHGPRMDGGPLVPVGDCLVDIILPDRGADDRMDRGREVLGPRHPIA